MKNLFQELMKSLKITFQEEQSKIKYDEYYFNGIAIPKNIEFKNVTYKSLNLFWDIDNINIININNNEIKFRVEMRKENEKFNQIYEGNNKNCSINSLTKNTNYEFRICSIYNNLIGSWNKIVKIKTDDYSVDSIILIESKRFEEFTQKIFEWSNYKKMELIFRGSRDGMNPNSFHSKCDNQGPTICLYQNDKGFIFGGYASISWKSDGKYHVANDCFIFTLTNVHNTQPTKFPTNGEQGVRHHSSYGPSFGEGCDIYIKSDFYNSSTDFPCRYKDELGKGRSIFTGCINNNKTDLKIKEIEVFKLYK